MTTISPLLQKCLQIITRPRQMIFWQSHNSLSYYHRSDDYQYLDDSLVPTDKFQRSMPRLTIPKLGDTLKRYLDSQRPLLSPDHLRLTEKLAQEFEDGIGGVLDRELRWRSAREEESNSYASKAYSDGFLRDRSPVVFNSNSGGSFVLEGSELGSMGTAASCLIISSLRYFKSLKANRLNPPIYDYSVNSKANSSLQSPSLAQYFPERISTSLAHGLLKVCPTDLSTFDSFFQTSRIPRIGMDELVTHEDSKHICLFRNGHIYCLEAMNEKGQLFEPAYYFDAIQTILKDDPEVKPTGIAALTTLGRDKWAKLRAHLSLLSEDNLRMLQKVESAILIVCLDEAWHSDKCERDVHSIQNTTYGLDPTNRWYDKSFNLLVGKEGQYGFLYEHSWGDGLAFINFVDRAFGDAVEQRSSWEKYSNRSATERVDLERLHFAVDDTLASAVEKAQVDFAAKAKSLEIQRCMMPFGSNDCKPLKISPDFVVQSAFQAAYHRQHGMFPSIHETCSTGAFRHGRVEVIRPLTMLSKKFVEAFNAASVKGETKWDQDTLLHLAFEASMEHKRLIREASQGKGWDMHLEALKNLCFEIGLELPSFYKDAAYDYMDQDVICSSSYVERCSKNAITFPTVLDGHGFVYFVSSNKTLINIAAQQDIKVITENIEKVMADMKNMLVAS